MSPNQNPLFLGIILAVCDKIADCTQLDLFGKATPTMEEFHESPEVVWLANYEKQIDFEALAAEELVKSQEVYTIFFSGDEAQEPAS